jgi:hypothetical protein|tara:strand:+ start:37682 stop:37795 length:114 start_codon:yes stop_codon:yes gene_type:complete
MSEKEARRAEILLNLDFRLHERDGMEFNKLQINIEIS